MQVKKEQSIIAELHKVFILRTEINEKLKAQIKDICPILIKGSIEEAKKNKGGIAYVRIKRIQWLLL